MKNNKVLPFSNSTYGLKTGPDEADLSRTGLEKSAYLLCHVLYNSGGPIKVGALCGLADRTGPSPSPVVFNTSSVSRS